MELFKDISTGFNNEHFSERTLKRILHNNKIYRRVVKKCMLVKEVNRKETFSLKFGLTTLSSLTKQEAYHTE